MSWNQMCVLKDSEVWGILKEMLPLGRREKWKKVGRGPVNVEKHTLSNSDLVENMYRCKRNE